MSMTEQEPDEPYKDEDGNYQFPSGDAFDAFLSDLAEQEIEEAVVNFESDDPDKQSLRDYVFETLHQSLDAHSLFIYNHPAAWGQAVYYADHASMYDWHGQIQADDPRETLRKLAYVCVEADLRHSISTKLDQYEGVPTGA
jgi:hypothetical protein